MNYTNRTKAHRPELEFELNEEPEWQELRRMDFPISLEKLRDCASTLDFEFRFVKEMADANFPRSKFHRKLEVHCYFNDSTQESIIQIIELVPKL